MRYCHYCGHIIPDDANFCPACGKNLTLSTVKKPEPAVQQQATRPTFTVSGTPVQLEKPARPRPQATKEQARRHGANDNSKPDKKQSSLWGCTVIVLLVALLAGGVLLTYNKLFDNSRHHNILAPEEDYVPDQQPPTRAPETTEALETKPERPKEPQRETPVIIDEEPATEVEPIEELPAEDFEQIQQEIKNTTQDN